MICLFVCVCVALQRLQATVRFLQTCPTLYRSLLCEMPFSFSCSESVGNKWLRTKAQAYAGSSLCSFAKVPLRVKMFESPRSPSNNLEVSFGRIVPTLLKHAESPIQLPSHLWFGLMVWWLGCGFNPPNPFEAIKGHLIYWESNASKRSKGSNTQTKPTQF